MSENTLLWLARMIGLVGLGLLVFSSIGGVVMASKITAKVARRLPFLQGGNTFTYHRRLSLVGASLFVLHPIPMLFAPKTTGGLKLLQVLLPFTAPKQTLWIALGTLAFYVLLTVTISALAFKRLKFDNWRILHYGTYLFLILGLAHGLFISGEFKAGELFEPDEPEKVVLLIMTGITLLFPAWRIWSSRTQRAKKLLRQN